MKFSTKCEYLEIGNDIHHFEKFLLIFSIGKGPFFSPISGLGKSLQYTNLYNVDVVDQEQQLRIHEHPVVHSQLDVLHLSRQDEEVGRECR